MHFRQIIQWLDGMAQRGFPLETDCRVYRNLVHASGRNPMEVRDWFRCNLTRRLSSAGRTRDIDNFEVVECASDSGDWGFVSNCWPTPHDQPVVSYNRRTAGEDCYECAEYNLHADLHSVYFGDHLVCDPCFEEHYIWSDNRGTYVHIRDLESGDDEDDPPRRSQPAPTGINLGRAPNPVDIGHVYDYSTNPLRYLAFRATPKEISQTPGIHNRSRFFGVELEVEVIKGSIHRKAETVGHTLGEFAILKSDGSLDAGFEIVSSPATFAYHTAPDSPWHALFKPEVLRGLRSYQTNTCGIHIHISRASMSELTIGKLVQFINSRDNILFIEKLAQRSIESNTYCKRKDGAKVTDSRRGEMREDRYQAVNLTRSQTVELRIFKGTLKPSSFFRYLEFTDALLTWLPGASVNTLTYPTFTEWLIRKGRAYPNLVHWCRAKGFMPKTKLAPGTKPDTRPDEADMVEPKPPLPGVDLVKFPVTTFSKWYLYLTPDYRAAYTVETLKLYFLRQFSKIALPEPMRDEIRGGDVYKWWARIPRPIQDIWSFDTAYLEFQRLSQPPVVRTLPPAEPWDTLDSYMERLCETDITLLDRVAKAYQGQGRSDWKSHFQAYFTSEWRAA